MTSTRQDALTAQLKWKNSEGKPVTFTLRGSPVSIGRAANCGIVLLNTSVSRHHARLEYDGTHYLLRDTNSANGVFINGARLSNTPCAVKHGDLLRIGQVEMSFKIIPGGDLALLADAPIRTTCLEVIKGWQKGLRFELTSEEIVLGRAGSSPDEVHIAILDRAVSRKQAKIIRQGDCFILTDLNSANGTRVNGILIQAPHTLRDGDALEMGETVMVFHVGSPSH